MKKILSFTLVLILICIGGCSTKELPKVQPKDCGKEFTSILQQATIGLMNSYHMPLGGVYKDNQEVENFINYMVENHNCNYNNLVYLFNNAKLQLTPLKIVAPKVYFEKYATETKTIKKIKSTKREGGWDRYKRLTLTKRHINEGVKFWLEYEDELQKAYEIYGVAPEYILGIMGVETIYGGNIGKHPVFDTLATLAFEKHKRSQFFKNELKKFLLMTRSEKLDINEINGSYAGAIGLGQFMPSNFDRFSVDFDNDGIRDLWNPKDAIGTIANYLSIHGWKRDELVTTRAKYKSTRFKRLKTGYKTRYSQKILNKRYKITPRERFYYKGRVSLIKLNRTDYDELWFGAKNFYVITRYNHSSYYAMAVYQLSQKVKERYLVEKKLALK